MPKDKFVPSDLQLVDMLESINDAFFILDKDFRFVWINKAYENISGAKRDESIGKVIWDLFPHAGKSDSPFWINYHKVIKTGKPAAFTTPNTRNPTWVEVTAYPHQDGGLFVFVRDITARVKAEQKLAESENRFRALVSARSDVLYRMNPDWTEMQYLQGNELYVTPGLPSNNWLELYIHPDDQEHVLAAIDKAKDTKTAFQMEHRVKQADGTLGWTFSRAIPIMDDNGNIIEWFGAATDITALKEAEKERQHQLETEQRMKLVTEQRNALIKINKAKDEFIAVASHQLRTPATAVKQYIGMLLENFAGPVKPSQERLLRTAYESNERELRLINDLLKTAQLDGSTPKLTVEPCDIVDLVKEAIADLQPTLKQRKQRIKFRCSLKEVKLLLDPTDMKLACSNLIENASKYSPVESLIKVDIKSTQKYIEIIVADNGVGIEAEDQKKVFEKFTRINNKLSDTVTGTGLGLYWVQQIAKMHGGHVELESEIGKGSTFTILLPYAEASNKPVKA